MGNRGSWNKLNGFQAFVKGFLATSRVLQWSNATAPGMESNYAKASVPPSDLSVHNMFLSICCSNSQLQLSRWCRLVPHLPCGFT